MSKAAKSPGITGRPTIELHATHDDDILELVDGGNDIADPHRVGGARGPVGTSAHVSPTSHTASNNRTHLLVNTALEVSMSSRGSSRSSNDLQAYHGAAVGVSGEASGETPLFRRETTQFLGVSGRDVPPGGYLNESALDGTEAGDGAAAAGRSRSCCSMSGAGLFVLMGVIFSLLLCCATVIISFATVSYVTDEDKSSAGAAAASSSVAFRLKIQYMTALTGTLSSLPVATARRVPVAAATSAARHPAVLSAHIANASSFTEQAAGMLLGFCDRYDVDDIAWCPDVLGATLTFIGAPTNTSDATTITTAYHISVLSTVNRTAGATIAVMQNVVAVDVDAFDSAAYPSAVAGGLEWIDLIQQRDVSAQTTHDSSGLANTENVTLQSAYPDSRRGLVDPVAFDATGAAHRYTGTSTPDSMMSRFKNRSMYVQAATLHDGHSSVLIDLHLGTLSSMRSMPLRLVNFPTAAIRAIPRVVSTVDDLLDTVVPRPFSRKCIVFYDRIARDHRILGCATSGEPEENDLSPLKNGQIRLDSRMNTLLDDARVWHLGAVDEKNGITAGSYVQPYTTTTLTLDKPTHVIAFGYIATHDALLEDGSHTIGELWVVNVELKTGTAFAGDNIPLHAGGVTIGFVVILTVTLLTVQFVLYVQPLRDVRHRMDQVARLDFSNVPSVEAQAAITASFDASANDDEAAERRACAEAEAQKNETLYPSTIVVDVQDLYEHFFHVASALKSVVPFLPEEYKVKMDDDDDDDVSLDPEGRTHRPNPLNGLAAFESHESTSDSDAAAGSGELEVPTRLSSISEIDLSDMRVQNVSSGAAGSQPFTSGAQLPELSVMTDSHGNESGQQQPLAKSQSDHASENVTPAHTTLRLPAGATPRRTSMLVAMGKQNTLLGGAKSPDAGKVPHTSSLKSSAVGSAMHVPEKAKHRYANETHNSTVIVAHFQLYLRKAARDSVAVAGDLQKEFITSAVAYASARKGQVSAITPHSIVVLWSCASPELKACTAASEFYRHMKSWGITKKYKDAFRTSVGICHGMATVGVLGTSSKKFFVCEGVTVTRASVYASTGIHNHAGVVVTETVNNTVRMFATLRPVEVLHMPRALRRDRTQNYETVYQCLFMDDQEDDQEWMYRLEDKGATAAAAQVASPSNANALPPSLSGLLPLVLAAQDDSEMACFIRGHVAWCTGRLVTARQELSKALALAQKAGHEDQCVTRRVRLLNDMADHLGDDFQTYFSDTSALQTSQRSGSGSRSDSPSGGIFAAGKRNSTMSMISVDSFATRRTSSTDSVASPSVAGVRQASNPVLGGTNASDTSHGTGDSMGGKAGSADRLPGHIRRAAAFFESVVGGRRVYAREAFQTGADAMAFEL